MMDPHPLEIASLGAAGEVTGSCFRLDTSRARFLVDCGMFQGGGDADAKNAAALPFDVAAPDFVILTHVHIDHSGLLPVLHARGFRGPVDATPATIGLLGVMLPDSAHIQEKEADAGALTDARRAETGRPPQGSRPRPGDAAHHRHAGARRSEHDAAPLYTVADAEDTLRLLTAVGYGIVFEPKPSVRFRFRDAGHILGAAIIELWLDGDRGARKFVFSGDLGQSGRPVMSDPTPIASADVLVVESTYGNRLHKSLASTYDELAQVLASTLPRGTSSSRHSRSDGRRRCCTCSPTSFGKGASPASRFSSTRRWRRVQPASPRNTPPYSTESRELTHWLAQHQDTVGLRFTETPQDSMAINNVRSGAVLIAAGGMCEGGRIRHHLRHNLPRVECAIVFTGLQAAGTLGRRIVDGATYVRLFREDVPVRASVHTIGGLSAHADQAALLGRLSGFRAAPARTFVVHGEQETASRFAQLIRERLRWTSVDVPRHGERIPVA